MTGKVSKNLITQRINKKIVIFDSDKSVLYTLNETSSYIFSKLKLGWNKDQIIKALSQTYQVEDEQLEQDFRELIRVLKSKKIFIAS